MSESRHLPGSLSSQHLWGHDSNFNSIVVAISEGRRLFLNIRRFIVHLLSTNVAEVLILILGLSFLDESGMSVFPLSPIGVLWVNLVS